MFIGQMDGGKLHKGLYFIEIKVEGKLQKQRLFINK